MCYFAPTKGTQIFCIIIISLHINLQPLEYFIFFVNTTMGLMTYPILWKINPTNFESNYYRMTAVRKTAGDTTTITKC